MIVLAAKGLNLYLEVDRLREFGEFTILDEVALKLRQMSSAAIDRKLKHQRDIKERYCTF